MNRSVKLALLAITVTALAACVEGAPEDNLPEDEEVGEAEQAAGTVVNHFVWSGGNADTWFGDEFTWTNIGIYEGGTPQDRRVSLSYWSQSVDPTSYECQEADWDGNGTIEPWEMWCGYSRGSWSYGWGEVPSSAVKMNKKGANVDVALGGLANFYGESCSWDWDSGQTCTNGAVSGDINLLWQSNGEYSQSQNGTQTYNYGAYSFRSIGTSSYASANVAGTAFGSSVDAKGTIGQGKNVSIDRIRN